MRILHASSASRRVRRSATTRSMSGSTAACHTKPFVRYIRSCAILLTCILKRPTSIALNNRAPYKTCVTHGFVVDLDGKKISKSGSYEKPTAADHFVGRYGADLLRLWASSIDYTTDVPFSEEMFTRLGDAYRRIQHLAYFARKSL